MREIKPNDPVVFEDEFSFPHWGVALSPVFMGPDTVERNKKGHVVAGPWPMVLIRVAGRTEPVRVPARDVEVWVPALAAVQARAASS